MVELQLEKISPLPVTQIVWDLEVVEGVSQDLQTVIILIAERAQIEQRLGRLETDGFLADRLELPLLQKLLAASRGADGAWVLVETSPMRSIALVAWRIDGVLQQLNLIHLPPGEAGPRTLVEELARVAWGGEVEGWLLNSPAWQLVMDPAEASPWLSALETQADSPPTLHTPPDGDRVAALTARRAASAPISTGLLPPEYSARYRQQFVDRLWMRGLAAVTLVYIVGVLGYFAALEVLKYQENRLKKQVAQLSGSYTNAQQLKAKVQILQDQVNLRYAGLDCWKVTSELLPSELTLTSFNFLQGNKLRLRGTTPSDQQTRVTEYNSALAKATLNNVRLFSKVTPATIEIGRGNASANWSFECEVEQSLIR
jgi:hypothetical protein